MSDECPVREMHAIPTTGDPAEDARIIDRAVLGDKRQIEGICPNGCAEMILDDPYNRHCPECGFHGSSNVPFAEIERRPEIDAQTEQD